MAKPYAENIASWPLGAWWHSDELLNALVEIFDGPDRAVDEIKAAVLSGELRTSRAGRGPLKPEKLNGPEFWRGRRWFYLDGYFGFHLGITDEDGVTYRNEWTILLLRKDAMVLWPSLKDPFANLSRDPDDDDEEADEAAFKDYLKAELVALLADPGLLAAPEVEALTSDPKDPKVWLVAELERRRNKGDLPQGYGGRTKFSRQTAERMCSAHRKRQVTKALSAGRIRNLLRDLKLWPSSSGSA